MSNDAQSHQMSNYLQYLPAIYQQDADEKDNSAGFIGRFLLAFEHLLSGSGDRENPGLEEIIDKIHIYFDPHQTPEEFLSWLAGWVALRLRDDWDIEAKRNIISEIVPMYRKRGTREGLQWALKTYTRANLKWNRKWEPEVNELNTAFQIGVHSTIGEDTWLDGGPPNFFKVCMLMITWDPEIIRQHYEMLTSIINMEKPAHTVYELDLITPTFQIGAQSHLGVNTLLGTINE